LTEWLGLLTFFIGGFVGIKNVQTDSYCAGQVTYWYYAMLDSHPDGVGNN